MRTVSFSDPKVQRKLDNEFLCSFSNITGQSNTGQSFKHSPNEAPGPCGRGAGRQNVQTIFLTPRGEIFHTATGFLSPDDLMGELDFASRAYEKIGSSGSNPQQTLVGIQSDRLGSIGFSRDEIYRPNMMQELTTGFSPADLGMQLPTSNMFGDVGKNRILRDAQYVIKNPLIHRTDFEENPSELVGRHGSFFGSNPAMNILGNQSFGRPRLNR